MGYLIHNNRRFCYGYLVYLLMPSEVCNLSGPNLYLYDIMCMSCTAGEEKDAGGHAVVLTGCAPNHSLC